MARSPKAVDRLTRAAAGSVRGRLSVAGGSVWPMVSSAFRPSAGIRVLMLAAAYAPLLILLAVLDSFRIGWLRWVLVALAGVGVLATVLFFSVAVAKRNATPEKIHAAKPREGEALKFFASYVVPFFITTTAVPAARWGLLIYLIFIAVLYVQGDMYFSNPLLALLGYRVFELTRADRGHLIVISREWHLAPGEVIRLVPLGGYVYVHLRDTHPRDVHSREQKSPPVGDPA